MKRLLFLLLLFPFLHADSDASGILANAKEDVKIAFINSSSNSYVTTANCSLNIFYPNNTAHITQMPMNHTVNGLYNYTWSAPATPIGLYSFTANCSDNMSGRQFFAGSAYVVQVLATNYSSYINATAFNIYSISNGNFSALQANVTGLNGKLDSIGSGVQANSSGILTALSNGINSVLAAMNGNFSILQVNVTSILSSFSSIAGNVWAYQSRNLTDFNFSVNASNVNVTVLVNQTSVNTTITQTVDTSSITGKIDDLTRKLDGWVEDIMRLLREIRDVLGHKIIIG